MQEFLELCKTFARHRFTASGPVNQTPAFLFSAHLVAGSGGIATATLHNGQGAATEALVDLTAPQGLADPRYFVPPIYFDRGIYLTLGTHATALLLQFRQLGDFQPSAEKRPLKSYLPSWLGGSPRGEKNI